MSMIMFQNTAQNIQPRDRSLHTNCGTISRYCLCINGLQLVEVLFSSSMIMWRCLYVLAACVVQQFCIFFHTVCLYRVFQKNLNDKNPFPWGIPHYQWSNMAYNTLLDAAPCHYYRNVRNFLNETLLHRWIGRAVNDDQHLLQYSGHWGHRTWHLVIFFLWGYVKDNAYKPPLPQNVRELQDRIRAAVQTVDGNMLKRVWQELDYRIDICRVTKGAHIEQLWADLYW